MIRSVEGRNEKKTLDTINLAYEKLLDSFFEDAAMDHPIGHYRS